MKIEHAWTNGVLTWDDADTLCISVVFTWQLPKVREYIRAIPGRRVRLGGPAIETAKATLPGFWEGLSIAPGGDYPGVLQRFNPYATRTSIGCIRKCGFCGVPLGERVKALEQFGRPQVPLTDWPDLPIISDNNLLANPLAHFDRVCDRLEKHDWCDFNQGTDARLVTPHHAERIARLKRPIVRLALDSMSYVDAWDRALERLLRAGVAKSRIRTYALIAWTTSPEESWKVCDHIESNGIKVLPQWFHSLDALEHNIVSPQQSELGWNDYERRRIMQWFYHHKKARQ